MEKCHGHRRREELRKRLREARKFPSKKIDASKRIDVELGAGQFRQMNLGDLAERERVTPEWKEVARGGLRVIPVTEYTLRDQVQ